MRISPRTPRVATVAAATLGATLVAGLPATAGAASPTSPTDAAPPRVARIYVSLPREGKGAASAARIALGLRTALADHGAIAGGRRIRLVWLNDARGARWARSLVIANAKRAAADPTAIAYVGEGNSEATALSMPIVNRAGLPHLSPVSTAVDLTAEAATPALQPTGVRTFFRPFPDDARQALALISEVRRSGRRGRVVLVDDGGMYGHGLTSSFAAAGARAGVTVIARHLADPDGRNLAAVARAVAADRPSAVVYGGAPSSGAAAVLRAIHAASPSALLFGGDALANDDLAADLSPAVQRQVRLTAPAAHPDPRAKVGRGLGVRPGAFAVFSHNGMTALLRATDRAGEAGPVTRESVRAAIFDGTVQHGLSGAWTIEANGDAAYGVYDSLRLVGGRVQTPVDRATSRLLRRERSRRATPRATTGVGGTTSIVMQNIQSMDIETALMMVQTERAKLLDAQLQTQIQEVQNRNEQVAKLNTVLVRLNAVAAMVVGTDATSRVDLSRDAGRTSALLSAMSAAGISKDSLYLGEPATWAKGTLDAATATVKGMIDAAGTSQQMDMLRLQSMSNKRNEAFDVMTNFLKKMQESQASIIDNMH